MTPRLESKAWYPAGFSGIEIVKDSCLFGRLCEPKQLTIFTDLTVHTCGRSDGYAFFDKTYHRPTNTSLEGLVFLQNAGDVWEVDACFTEPTSTWTVRLLQGQEGDVLGSLGLEARAFHLEQTALTPRIRRRLADDIARTARSFDLPTSTLERESRLLELLAFALNHCCASPLKDEKLGQEHRAVGLVREVLETRPEQDNTLAELADLTKLNPHYLYRVFLRDVGLSPHSYQTSIRLHRVKALLAAGTSIAQAALELGFNDQSHLTHVFKKYTRVTPGRFQRDSLDDERTLELSS